MRLSPLAVVAALATASACSSPTTETATPPPPAPSQSAATSTAPRQAADKSANVPGFSGPADPPTATKPGHVFGRCLHSWFTTTKTALRVHVDYPGPALVNVDVMITDNSTPPPGTHQDFTMAAGEHAKDLTFPAMPHADYVQINPVSDRGALTCDAAKH